MGKKSEPPKGPDYDDLLKLQTAQFEQNKELFDEYMDFTKTAYDDQKALQDKLVAVQLPGMERQDELSRISHERYLKMGIPFEDKYLGKLTNWDTAGRREDRAAQASADIGTAAQQARENELQRLESYGIDPSQTRSAALDSRLSLQTATQQALAGNQARRQVEQEGMAYGADALNIYKGMPAQSATALQVANQSGQMAFGNQAQLAAMGSQPYVTGANMNTQNSQMMNQAYGTAGNLHRNDLAAWEMNQAYGPAAQFGNLAGAALGALPYVAEGGPVRYAAEGGVPVTPSDEDERKKAEHEALLSILRSNRPSGTGASSAGSSLATALGNKPRTTLNNVSPAALSAMKSVLPGRADGGGSPQPAAMPRPGSQGIPPDNQPVMMTPGEFVIPDDVARWEGEKSLQKMINKAREERVATEQQRAQNQRSMGIPA